MINEKVSHLRQTVKVRKSERRLSLIEGYEKPLLCQFCGKEIINLKNSYSDSLVIHSLDGDHENWDPANKTPAHNGCHITYHQIMRGAMNLAKHPMPPPMQPYLAPPLDVAMFFVDYDLPQHHSRRQFYRAIHRYRREHFMEETGWSTQSVVITESKDFAYLVYQEALKVGGKAHIWRATRIEVTSS